MQTERLKRLRAWAGGWGVSTRMDARHCSSQSRAMLKAGAVWATRATPEAQSQTSTEQTRKGRQHRIDGGESFVGGTEQLSVACLLVFITAEYTLTSLK